MKLIVFILTVFSCLYTTSLAQSADEKLEVFIRNEMKLKGIPDLPLNTSALVLGMEPQKKSGTCMLLKRVEKLYRTSRLYTLLGVYFIMLTKNAKGQIDFISIEKK